MALSINKGNTEKKTNVTVTSNPAPAEVKAASETEKAKVVATTQVTAPQVDPDILSSKSDTIAFVSPLGDPSHPDTVIGKDGKKSVTSYIVGYRLKALADMEVPDVPLDVDARNNLMSFKTDMKNNKRAVKAGQTFDVTRFELGLLLAEPEFNGRITGDGKGFTAVYQLKTAKAGKGNLGKVSATSELPTVSLKSDTGSIKDYDIIDVLTYESKPISEGSAITRKVRKITEGFERFEGLAVNKAPRPRTAGTKTSSTPKNRRNPNAEAFLKILAGK